MIHEHEHILSILRKSGDQGFEDNKTPGSIEPLIPDLEDVIIMMMSKMVANIAMSPGAVVFPWPVLVRPNRIFGVGDSLTSGRDSS